MFSTHCVLYNPSVAFILLNATMPAPSLAPAPERHAILPLKDRLEHVPTAVPPREGRGTASRMLCGGEAQGYYNTT